MGIYYQVYYMPERLRPGGRGPPQRVCGDLFLRFLRWVMVDLSCF